MHTTWLTHGEWVMSILTFMYVFVAILTLWQIKRQVDGMKASNEISRKNLVVVQRAFVFYKQTDFVLRQDPLSHRVIDLQVRGIWEN